MERRSRLWITSRKRRKKKEGICAELIAVVDQLFFDVTAKNAAAS